MTGDSCGKAPCPACVSWQTDEEIALDALSRGASVAIVKEGQLLAAENGKGVMPLLKALGKIGDRARGAFFADKVVGKAAAMIMIDAGAGSVYAVIMSEPGAAVLCEHGIPYVAENSVDHITDRTGTGVCPIEQISLGYSDCRELRAELEKKFSSGAPS